ncbi:hypothetical protein [Psychrobacter sp. FDAARGOS_221]|uniref:hypothetical protein n=1 Tax=Psychrobacter sp. FDAARGOS_221 TaxID=1975705 RepID=UPI000BB54D29|nr:hypothetical protein [Psychrobacter sp. FDAARGOS_221]PNK61061.1 hypothetical protein A6J60_009355 [Psychrobacter sp. FDAARGOS_221]
MHNKNNRRTKKPNKHKILSFKQRILNSLRPNKRAESKKNDNNKSQKSRLKSTKSNKKYPEKVRDQSAFIIKLTTVFIPYVLVGIVSITLCILCRYLFDIRWDVLDISELWWDFIIPIVITTALLVILLRPRYTFLKIGSASNSATIIFVIMIISIILPAMMGQAYLLDRMTNIVNVQTIGEVAQYPDETHFKVNADQQVDPKQFSYIVNYRETKSRYDFFKKDYEMTLFVVAPFKEATNIWLTGFYDRSISYSLSEQQQLDEANAFFRQSKADFFKHNNQNVKFYKKQENISSSSQSVYMKAIKSSSVPITTKPILLKPYYISQQELMANTLRSFFYLYFIGLAMTALIVFSAKIDINYDVSH